MWKNPSKVVIETCETAVDALDLFRINIRSLKTLSLAGNEKANLVLEATKQDVVIQRMEFAKELEEAGLSPEEPSKE